MVLFPLVGWDEAVFPVPSELTGRREIFPTNIEHFLILPIPMLAQPWAMAQSLGHRQAQQGERREEDENIRWSGRVMRISVIALTDFILHHIISYCRLKINI